MNISNEQAREIAKVILFDIDKYIQEHLTDYNEWLRLEEMEEKNDESKKFA